MRAAGDPSRRAIALRITGLAVVIRLALEIAGLLSIAPMRGRAFPRALSMWVRWDAGHYLRIAKVGYRAHGGDDPLFIVFFPMYPVVVRIVSVAVRNVLVSGLLVSFVASVGAGLLLYELVRLDADHDSGHDEAWRSVVLLFTFPTAFVLAAPYSESLFLFAVLAAIYAARTGRWARAGLAGALATGTRLAGTAVVPALALQAFTTPGSRTQRTRRLAFVALSGAGILGYFAINQVVHSDPFWFLHVQRSHWFQHAVPPWEPIVDAVSRLIEGGTGSTYTFVFASRLVAVAFAVPMLVLATRRLRVVDAVYGWAGLVVVLSASWLISLPRYLLPLYPIFLVEAKLVRGRAAFWTIAALGMVAQAFLFWRFVRGDWAY